MGLVWHRSKVNCILCVNFYFLECLCGLFELNKVIIKLFTPIKAANPKLGAFQSINQNGVRTKFRPDISLPESKPTWTKATRIMHGCAELFRITAITFYPTDQM